MGNDSLADVVRALIEDPEFLRALTHQIRARTADPQLVDRLVAYARDRQATTGQAIARRMLTDAGVSWESL